MHSGCEKNYSFRGLELDKRNKFSECQEQPVREMTRSVFFQISRYVWWNIYFFLLFTNNVSYFRVRLMFMSTIKYRFRRLVDLCLLYLRRPFFCPGWSLDINSIETHVLRVWIVINAFINAFITIVANSENVFWNRIIWLNEGIHKFMPNWL